MPALAHRNKVAEEEELQMISDDDIDTLPPPEIGPLVSRLINDRRMTMTDLVIQTGIPYRTIASVCEGSREFDRTIANRLKPVFGSAADTLYKIQLAANFYKVNRRAPNQFEFNHILSLER